MNKYIEHFKTVAKHKYYVFKQCAGCGLYWQGLIHDLSKLTPAEFFPSARYFQGNRSPIEAEKEDIGYSAAWLHHKGHNKHHWEYWVDFNKSAQPIPAEIPLKYVVEMICDFIGAGMAYQKTEWTTDSPLNYFGNVVGHRYYHKNTESLIWKYLYVIRDFGLEQFYSTARYDLAESKKASRIKEN